MIIFCLLQQFLLVRYTKTWCLQLIRALVFLNYLQLIRRLQWLVLQNRNHIGTYQPSITKLALKSYLIISICQLLQPDIATPHPLILQSFSYSRCLIISSSLQYIKASPPVLELSRLIILRATPPSAILYSVIRAAPLKISFSYTGAILIALICSRQETSPRAACFLIIISQ